MEMSREEARFIKIMKQSASNSNDESPAGLGSPSGSRSSSGSNSSSSSSSSQSGSSDSGISSGSSSQSDSESKQKMEQPNKSNINRAELWKSKPSIGEVKGSSSNVIVSWDEKKGEGVVDDSEKTDASGQMMDCGKLSQMTLLADAVSTTEDTSSEATETNVKQESVHNGCVRTLWTREDLRRQYINKKNTLEQIENCCCLFIKGT